MEAILWQKRRNCFGLCFLLLYAAYFKKLWGLKKNNSLCTVCVHLSLTGDNSALNTEMSLQCLSLCQYKSLISATVAFILLLFRAFGCFYCFFLYFLLPQQRFIVFMFWSFAPYSSFSEICVTAGSAFSKQTRTGRQNKTMMQAAVRLHSRDFSITITW